LSTTTTYTLACKNQQGVETKEEKIIVVAALNPVSITLNASPLSVAYQGKSNLSWTTTNAKSCTLNGVNTYVNLSTYATPALSTTTTYTLACKNQQGAETKQERTIVVTQPNQPTASITAEGSDASTTIAFGNTANISWSSTNAKTCRVTGGTINSAALSGSQNTGNLSVPTTYTISCTNIAGQTVTDSVIVNVIAKDAPTVIFNESTTVDYNGRVLLEWKASGTTQSCTLNGAAVALTGSREIKNITTNSTQTLKCKNDANGEVIKVLNIKIIINPATAFVAWEDVLNLINLLRK
jgi:hypothetical protein